MHHLEMTGVLNNFTPHPSIEKDSVDPGSHFPEPDVRLDQNGSTCKRLSWVLIATGHKAAHNSQVTRETAALSSIEGLDFAYIYTPTSPS